MQKIVFATNNPHKLEEVRRMAAGKIEILSLADIGCHDDIPETADTLAGNALIKARYVSDRYGLDCFADDTGLMVDALGGAPGVLSARYAGPGHDSAANMALLLRNMGGVTDRSARFVTAIALVRGGQTEMFEGKVEGQILTKPSGDGGFGYDPIFAPVETGIPFAEMTPEAKNAISHRGRAVRALMERLLGSES
ncbi:MAG: RdgB/HAM1 family non-canonical purine NTP pyrophosphatase [Duncaniella sp.]|nr:RdgB/HAM1 family non-canonical purine NTP pyrophosphatase [Duncaniella sp.]